MERTTNARQAAGEETFFVFFGPNGFRNSVESLVVEPVFFCRKESLGKPTLARNEELDVLPAALLTAPFAVGGVSGLLDLFGGAGGAVTEGCWVFLMAFTSMT